MALAEQMIDPELRMILHVDPVLVADVGVDDEGAVVKLMAVVDRIGDIDLLEGTVESRVGEFADGDVADVVVGFVDVLGAARRVLRQFRLLCLVVAFIRRRLLLAGDVATRHGAIRPDLRLRITKGGGDS